MPHEGAGKQNAAVMREASCEELEGLTGSKFERIEKTIPRHARQKVGTPQNRECLSTQDAQWKRERQTRAAKTMQQLQSIFL